MAAIVDLCLEISKWDINKVLEFRRKVKPILEHNFNLMKERPEAKVSKKIAKYMIDQLALTGQLDYETYKKIREERGLNS
jgi:hypothetical protein